MLRFLLEWTARKFKGAQYRIDPGIPLTGLVGFAVRRLSALVRSLLMGIGIRRGLGSWIFLGENVKLRNRVLIHLGKGVTLGSGVLIDGLSRRGVRLGDNVNIGPYTIIEATGVISNLGEGCSIGQNSGMGAFSYIGAAGGVSIGEDVIMGQRVSFHSENHLYVRTDAPIRTQGISRKGIIVEDDCWIGANVVFIDGAHVGRGCVIGAGAVVRGVIPSYSIAVGVPARVVRSRGKPEK